MIVASRAKSADSHRFVKALFAVLLGFLPMAIGAVWAEDPNPATIHSNRGAWPLYRQWNAAETRHFAAWIENIYRVKTQGAPEQWLAKLERVLTDPEMNLLLDPAFAGSPANPQLGLDTIRAVHSVVDCAKLTVALSSYYAYRRGLPWMITCVRSPNGGDLRTSEYNVPSSTISSFDYASAHAFFVDAVTTVCTGNYRVELGRDRSELSDTVPVGLDRAFLMPGCVYYLDGHILMLAHVDALGEPHFLDATTSPSRDIYTHNRFNAVTGITPRRPDAPQPYAGCYRGFRVHRYPIAEVDAKNQVKRVRRRTDAEMAEFGFSTEQYEKMQEWLDQRRIVEGGIALSSFHDFVRLRLRPAERFSPVQELARRADDMLALMKQREEQVQAGERDVRENGPIAFPEGHASKNVFRAGGRWDAYSSALLDLTFRARYFDLLAVIENAAAAFDATPAYLDLTGLNADAIWTGPDLAFALWQEKNRVFAASTFAWTDSTGQGLTLSLRDVEQRLYELSFDPNHPPELRWGVQPVGTEAQGAGDHGTPLPNGTIVPMAEAYRREAYYRALVQWETDASFLRKMITEGFPVQKKIDECMAERLARRDSPPLVPHNGRAAYETQTERAPTSAPAAS